MNAREASGLVHVTTQPPADLNDTSSLRLTRELPSDVGIYRTLMQVQVQSLLEVCALDLP